MRAWGQNIRAPIPTLPRFTGSSLILKAFIMHMWPSLPLIRAPSDSFPTLAAFKLLPYPVPFLGKAPDQKFSCRHRYQRARRWVPIKVIESIHEG